MAEQLPRTTLVYPWLVVSDDDPAVTVTLPAGVPIIPRYLRSLRRWAVDVEGSRYTSARKPSCDPAVDTATHAVKSGPPGRGNPVLSVRLTPDVRESLDVLASERGMPPSTLAGELLSTVVNGVMERRKR